MIINGKMDDAMAHEPGVEPMTDILTRLDAKNVVKTTHHDPNTAVQYPVISWTSYIESFDDALNVIAIILEGQGMPGESIAVVLSSAQTEMNKTA